MRPLLNSPRGQLRLGCAALALFVLWFAAAYPRGVLMAHIDHARGHYDYLHMGSPVAWFFDASRLLADQYGVEISPAPGVMGWDVWYMEGYNSASRQLLTTQFGKDVIAECFSRAEQEYRAKHPEQFDKAKDGADDRK